MVSRCKHFIWYLGRCKKGERRPMLRNFKTLLTLHLTCMQQVAVFQGCLEALRRVGASIPCIRMPPPCAPKQQAARNHHPTSNDVSFGAQQLTLTRGQRTSLGAKMKMPWTQRYRTTFPLLPLIVCSVNENGELVSRLSKILHPMTEGNLLFSLH